jgi:hypothetical protein
MIERVESQSAAAKIELNLVYIANMTCIGAEEDVHVLCNVGAHGGAFHLSEKDKAD